MKLPNPDKAHIPTEKLTEYALNPEHPTGKHKAFVFESVLGLTLKDANFLQTTIQDIVLTHDAEPESETPYGNRYVIDFILETPAGTAMIRTSWIVRYGEDFPRLTSCYVK